MIVKLNLREGSFEALVSALPLPASGCRIWLTISSSARLVSGETEVVLVGDVWSCG